VTSKERKLRLLNQSRKSNQRRGGKKGRFSLNPDQKKGRLNGNAQKYAECGQGFCPVTKG